MPNQSIPIMMIRWLVRLPIQSNSQIKKNSTQNHVRQISKSLNIFRHFFSSSLFSVFFPIFLLRSCFTIHFGECIECIDFFFLVCGSCVYVLVCVRYFFSSSLFNLDIVHNPNFNRIWWEYLLAALYKNIWERVKTTRIQKENYIEHEPFYCFFFLLFHFIFFYLWILLCWLIVEYSSWMEQRRILGVFRKYIFALDETKASIFLINFLLLLLLFRFICALFCRFFSRSSHTSSASSFSLCQTSVPTNKMNDVLAYI